MIFLLSFLKKKNLNIFFTLSFNAKLVYFFLILRVALENKNATSAMEQHRSLVTQHINVSTQWAPALRQLILSISPEIELTAQCTPAEQAETEAVQLMDVSNKPIGMDSLPIFPLDSTIGITNPLTDIQQSNLPQNEIETINTNVNVNTDESTNQNAPKSKFGRFGRILHI